eukprot:jgi/Chlat1/1383/Chrsp12S02047
MASAQALRAWACLAQALLLAVLCLTRPVQGAFPDDEPILHATYYSAQKGSSLYVNEPVIIDAECSMLYGNSSSQNNSTLVFCFNTGGQPASSGDAVCNNDGRRTWTYDTPGWKSVWVSCRKVSNMALTPDDAIFGGPSTTLRLYVQPKQGCFRYGATTDLQTTYSSGFSVSLPSSAHTTMYLRVYDPQDPKTDIELLSQQFAQSGDYPSVRLLPFDAYLRRDWPGGISHTGILEDRPAGSINLASNPAWDPVRKAWAVDMESGAEPSSVIAVMYSSGVTIMGCSVELTRILVYVPAFASSMPQPKFQKDVPLLSGPIHISCSTCSPGASVFALTKTSTILATNNSWGASTQAVDVNALFREAATDMVVHAAAMLCSDVLLLTSGGLVRWTPKAQTATLIDGLSLHNVASAAISVQPPPLGSADSHIYVSASSSGAMQVYWSNRDDLKTWTKSKVADAARVTSLQDYYYNRTLHLVSASDGTQAQIWQEDNHNEPTPKLLYTFYLDAKIVGISMPCSGADLYAFGSAIWHAPDTNSSIRLLQSLPALAVHIACSAGGGVAFLTDAGQVYYSRRGFNQLATISTPTAYAADSSTPVAFGINFDWQGELQFLEVRACNTSAAATTDENGQKVVVASLPMLHNTSLCLAATTLPLDSELRASDSSTAVALAPRGFHASVLSAIGNSSQVPFEASSLGRIVVTDMVEPSGALVADIQEASVVVELPVNTVFKAATVADSPAQQQELTVSAVEVNIGSASWLILSPYVPTTVALATATGPINVKSTAVSSSAGWLFSDVGKTAVTGQNSATVTQFVNSSHAQAIISAQLDSKHFSVAAGQWQLLDFRAYREEARTSSEQQLRVYGDPESSKYFTASLSDGWMRFRSTDYSKILAVGTGWGFIARVMNSSAVSVYIRQSVAPGTHSAGNWSMYSVEPGQQCNALPHTTCRARIWHLKLPPCGLVSFLGPPLTGADTIFMDMQDAATATVIIDPPTSPVDITMANPQLLIYSARDKIASADGIIVANKTVTMLARRAAGLGFLSIQPQRTSLLCQATQLAVHVLVGCPETKYITPVGSLRPFSNQNGTVTPPVKLMPIPTNYRPPSRFGKGVPTSANIYHADPSQSLHLTRFKVSRNTGRFQQCASKANRAGCGCNATQVICQLPSESDCCTQAIAFYMQDVLVPRFLIKQANRADRILPLPYQLVESVIMDGSNPYGIKFFGTELYNFEVTVLPTHSFCNLTTGFAVWVTHPPLKITHWYLTVSLIVTVMALGMLAVYVLFVYHYGTQFR